MRKPCLRYADEAFLFYIPDNQANDRWQHSQALGRPANDRWQHSQVLGQPANDRWLNKK